MLKCVLPRRDPSACSGPRQSKADSFFLPIERLEWVVMHLKPWRQLGEYGTLSHSENRTELKNASEEIGGGREREFVGIVTLKV